MSGGRPESNARESAVLRSLPWLGLLGAVGAYVAHVVWIGADVVDDAFISFRYARHLVAGEGLSFNVGEAPVEGYTNFLWVLLSALVLELGGDVPKVMPLIGSACGALLVAATGLAARRAQPSPGPSSGLLAAALTASYPGLAYYATSGLETTAFALLLSAAGFALALARPVAFGVLAALSFLLRPEAGLLIVLGLPSLAWVAEPGRRGRSVALAALCLGPACAAYLVFKLTYFGALLPNTLLAKPGELARGLRYSLEQGVPLVGLAAFALYVAARARQPRLTTLAGIWWCFFAAVLLVGGDWMPAGRLYAHFFPWLTLLVDVGLQRFLSRESGAPSRVPVLLGTLALIAYAPLSLESSYAATLTNQARAEYNPKRRVLVERLQRAGATSLGTVDIGLPGWVGRDLRILDLGGLTDRHVASRPGSHTEKLPAEEYLESRAPDAWLFASSESSLEAEGKLEAHVLPKFHVEGYVMSRPWFRAAYRYAGRIAMSPGYQVHVFSRKP